MLKKIIKMQCKSFDDNRANFSENEEIQKVELQCATLLKKIKRVRFTILVIIKMGNCMKYISTMFFVYSEILV